VSECSPLRVGFAAGAGPMLSAMVFSDSVDATSVAPPTLGSAGIARYAVNFAGRGSRPKAALGGVCGRAVFNAEVAGAEVAEAAAAGVGDAPVAARAEAGGADFDSGFEFAFTTEFAGAAADAATAELSAGPYTSTTRRSGSASSNTE